MNCVCMEDKMFVLVFYMEFAFVKVKYLKHNFGTQLSLSLEVLELVRKEMTSV
jgi:hypothetical protein